MWIIWNLNSHLYFSLLHCPPANKVIIDGLLRGLATLCGKLLHTWRSNQNMNVKGASSSSFKAEWYLHVFDIETIKGFQQLSDYCFHREHHNKSFSSSCWILKKRSQRVGDWKNIPTFASCWDELRKKFTPQQKTKKVTFWLLQGLWNVCSCGVFMIYVTMDICATHVILQY